MKLDPGFKRMGGNYMLFGGNEAWREEDIPSFDVDEHDCLDCCGPLGKLENGNIVCKDCGKMFSETELKNARLEQ